MLSRDVITLEKLGVGLDDRCWLLLEFRAALMAPGNCRGLLPVSSLLPYGRAEDSCCCSLLDFESSLLLVCLWRGRCSFEEAFGFLDA